jgi:hypothetical protein
MEYGVVTTEYRLLHKLSRWRIQSHETVASRVANGARVEKKSPRLTTVAVCPCCSYQKSAYVDLRSTVVVRDDGLKKKERCSHDR